MNLVEKPKCVLETTTIPVLVLIRGSAFGQILSLDQLWINFHTSTIPIEWISQKKCISKIRFFYEKSRISGLRPYQTVDLELPNSNLASKPSQTGQMGIKHMEFGGRNCPIQNRKHRTKSMNIEISIWLSLIHI